jgi:hypothetical protein
MDRITYIFSELGDSILSFCKAFEGIILGIVLALFICITSTLFLIAMQSIF